MVFNDMKRMYADGEERARKLHDAMDRFNPKLDRLGEVVDKFADSMKELKAEIVKLTESIKENTKEMKE